MTINDFETLVPMKYYNNEDETNENRIAMIENRNNEYMATEKHDGDWGMFIHYNRGHNLIRSRAISKITGKYGDYTAKLPHLCAEMDSWPDNTVVLAEICWDSYKTNANSVGTILRCLPKKAIERQKDQKLIGYIFDVLMLNGLDLTPFSYEQRFWKVSELCGTFFHPTDCFNHGEDFATEADRIIAAGGEGLVIQRKDNPYMAGTRTAWRTLKLKKSLHHMDVKVVAVLDPTKYYTGIAPDTWLYWIDEPDGRHPVTRPYYFGWKNGITILMPDGKTTCDVVSGLTDDDRIYLASDECAHKIAAGELWAEVKAMSINSQGRLRHPSLVRLRTDLDSHGE